MTDTVCKELIRIKKSKDLATCSIHRKAIFAADVLNFCVRDGNRCDHIAIVTRSLLLKLIPSKLTNNLYKLLTLSSSCCVLSRE